LPDIFTILTQSKDQADARERSSSVTIAGDENVIGDPDLVVVVSVDLRASRRAKRVRQLPTPESEIIVIDD
jgi:hypothetical protein